MNTTTPPLLNATVRGNGPVVVLLHGFLGSSRYWESFAEYSEKEYTVVAIDLLGFGNSPKPRRNSYDYEDHIASIDATLKHLSITDPFILVGHSMGALIALRYSVLFEDRVDKLVLANMPVMLGAEEVRDQILRHSFTYKYGLRPGTHHVAWSIFKTLYFLRLLPRRTMARLKTNSYFFQHNASSRMRSFQRIIGDARTDVDLRMVRVRTLVLSGLEDRAIYIENLTRRIALSPTVSLRNFPTGHHIPCVLPSELEKAIKS